MRKFFLADDAFDSDDEYGRNNRYRDLDDDYEIMDFVLFFNHQRESLKIP